jgi:tetratricopeptide (TPR) repeat protein
MIASRFILELLILAVSGSGTGLFFLRRIRCNPVEKLCLVIAVSWTVVYLAGTVIYLAHLPVKCHFAVTGISLVLLLLSFSQLKNLFSCRQVRQAIFGFIALYLWNLLLLSLVRHYSGGLWAGDWYEHYQRSLFFTDYLPRDTKFLIVYDLPARPPMMNILCAHVLAQAGETYDFYQPAAAFFNLLIYFPCFLLANALARRGRRQWLLLTVLFAASPILIENVTYPWTKLFAGFFILLGTWLYLRGWKKQDSIRIVGAFAALCVGMLVHYSAGPYLLFLGLHYVFIWAGRKKKWIEPPAIAAACVPILASWFAWSFLFYGWHDTVATNSTVAGTAKFSPVGNIKKLSENLLGTIVPHPLHISRADFDKDYYQPNEMGYLRDYWFLIYQPTVPEGIGLVGGLVVVYLLFKKLMLGKSLPLEDRIFWIAYTLFITFVGIAVLGAIYPVGVGQICLLPLSVLGITFLAANFSSLAPWLKRVVAVFVVFDFCMGVFLHIRMEQLYFQFAPKAQGVKEVFLLSDLLLSREAVFNSLRRSQLQLPYWGDHLQQFAGILLSSTILAGGVMCYLLAVIVGGRRPGRFLYILLAVLALGTAYAMHDALDGFDDTIHHQLSESLDQLKQDAADEVQAVQSEPDSSAAQLAAGEALYRTGDMQPATSAMTEAYILDLSNRRARYDSLLTYNTGTPFSGDATAMLEAAEDVTSDPDSQLDRQRLGLVLLKHNHPAQAAQQLSEAVRLGGNSSPDTLAMLGLACQQLVDQDHIQQSIVCLSQALRLRPGSAQIAAALRNSLHLRGDSDVQINSELNQIRAGG